MKERTVIISIVALLAAVALLATGNTDIIYIAASALFFAICVAYAAWCERL
jgi:hypothetical protein